MTPKQEAEEDKEVTELFIEDKLSEILIFSTSKQKTKLKATSQGLEYHLEDKREGKGGRQRTLSKHEVETILTQGAYSINPGYKARVGTVNIGLRRGWLYSKSLFPEPDYLKGEIRHLLESINS